MERGHDVHLVTERPNDANGWVDFNSCNVIYTGHLDYREIFVDQLWSTMKTLAPVIDAVYFSNEPSWPVEVIRDAIGKDKPLIVDFHDLVSIREERLDDKEKRAMECANGFMAPSVVYKRFIQEQTQGSKPVFEVLSCVPEKLFPTQRRTPSRHGIVYEGGLKGKPKETSDQFEFRSWAPVFKDVAKVGVEVWCYPSSSQEDYSEYAATGAMMMPSLPYAQLLKNLTAHEAGLVGSPFPAKAFDGALPNKMFEYIAAGIPMIVMNAPEAAKFVKATGFGVEVKHPAEIPDALETIKKEGMRDLVWDMRRHWTMEGQIGKVETLLNKLHVDDMFDKHGHGEVGEVDIAKQPMA